jgi:hypothetical protein
MYLPVSPTYFVFPPAIGLLELCLCACAIVKVQCTVTSDIVCLVKGP